MIHKSIFIALRRSKKLLAREVVISSCAKKYIIIEWFHIIPVIICCILDVAAMMVTIPDKSVVILLPSSPHIRSISVALAESEVTWIMRFHIWSQHLTTIHSVDVVIDVIRLARIVWRAVVKVAKVFPVEIVPENVQSRVNSILGSVKSEGISICIVRHPVNAGIQIILQVGVVCIQVVLNSIRVSHQV